MTTTATITAATGKKAKQDKKKPISPTTKIDLLWKDLFAEFSAEAILFFLGKNAFKAIDFSYPPDFLEQELVDAFAGNEPSKKVTDKIIRYKLKNGKFRFMILHVEFQGKVERNFAERMFRYFVFIYIKYRTKDVTALVIYTGASRPKVFDTFSFSFYGTKLSYKFNSYTVRDQTEAKLLKSDNPMALAVLASLWLIKAGKDVKQKLAYKKNLIEIARKKNFDRAKLLRLINFVRYIMLLPVTEELEFNEFITQPKNNVKMTYEVDFLELVAGDTVNEIRAKVREEEREKAREEREKEREKEREEREEAEQEREKVIMGIKKQLGYNAKQIATLVPYKIKYIQSVIDKFEKKEKEAALEKANA